MKKYFKKDSNIEVNLGDKVAFVRSGEFNGMNIYTKIEGELNEDNVEDLVHMDYLDVKDVEDAPCKCKCDHKEEEMHPLTELDKAIAGLEKVCEILKEFIG